MQLFLLTPLRLQNKVAHDNRDSTHADDQSRASRISHVQRENKIESIAPQLNKQRRWDRPCLSPIGGFANPTRCRRGEERESPAALVPFLTWLELNHPILQATSRHCRGSTSPDLCFKAQLIPFEEGQCLTQHCNK